MTTIPHPPALQLAARIGRDATLLQVSIIGLASDLDNSAFFTKNLKPLIKNLKPRELLHLHHDSPPFPKHILIHIFFRQIYVMNPYLKLLPLLARGGGPASAGGGVSSRRKWLRIGTDFAENPSVRASRSPSLGRGRSFLDIKFQCSDLCIRICCKQGRSYLKNRTN